MIELFKKILNRIAPKSAIDSLADSSSRIINGSFRVNQGTVDEKLKINGAAILGQNTIVKKSIAINGQLEATGVLFEADLFVNGTTDIRNSSLKQNAHFSGTLLARDCQFSGSIALLANDATYSHCQVNHIILHELPYLKAPQKIHLSNTCEITGDITFEAGNGEVWIDASSLIHGKVHGGKIIHT